MMIETIGFCATFLGVCKSVPQFLKIHSEDNVKSFSKESIMLGIISTILWIIYGVNKKSYCIIFAAFGALFYEFYILNKINKQQ